VYEARRDFVEDLIWISELLAELTEEAGLAVRPLGAQSSLEAVSLVRLEPHRVLGVVVTTDGRVRRRLCELGVARSAEQLQRVANFLSSEYRGWALHKIVEHLRDRAHDAADEDGERRIVRSLASHLCGALLSSEGSEPADIAVAGARRLLEVPEFADSERARAVVGVLYDAARLTDVLGHSLVSDEPCVLIGQESALTADGELALVASVFLRGGHRAGAVAVVGPRRMQYARVVPVVNLIGDTLTSMWTEGEVVHAG
jgi:heat-inducible transcriptional repressor